MRGYNNYSNNKEHILKNSKDKYHSMLPEKKLKMQEYQKNYQKNYRKKRKANIEI